MTTDNSQLVPIKCAGIVVMKDCEVLLIKRGTPPRQNEWSIPGGRIAPGESPEAAALRELEEETGLAAHLVGLIEIIEVNFDGKIYLLHDFTANWISGTPRAGDDAIAASFFPLEEITKLGMWPKTVQIIQKAADLLTP